MEYCKRTARAIMKLPVMRKGATDRNLWWRELTAEIEELCGMEYEGELCFSQI